MLPRINLRNQSIMQDYLVAAHRRSKKSPVKWYFSIQNKLSINYYPPCKSVEQRPLNCQITASCTAFLSHFQSISQIILLPSDFSLTYTFLQRDSCLTFWYIFISNCQIFYLEILQYLLIDMILNLEMNF